MKAHNLIVLAFLLIFAACSTKTAENKYLAIAEKMAISDMKRNPEPWTIDFQKKPKWEYTHGLMMTANLALYNETNNQVYLDYVNQFADMFIAEDGSILTYKLTDYNIDRVNPGKFLMELYKISQEERLLLAINNLRTQMKNHPRIEEGAFWHKKVYPHQVWLDGLYMGTPFLAQYAVEFNEPELFDDIALQYKVMNDNMYNPEVQLYYHGWDASKQQQWANPETGLSPNFWGRAMGWLAMAAVDALYWFPEEHAGREVIMEVIDRIAEGAAKHQDPETGLWWQVLDQHGREGNYLEASASSMLAYFYLKSVRLGFLDESYLENGIKAYNGIIDNLIQNEADETISLTQVCGVAGLGGKPYRDATYEYYVNEVIRNNDPKGVGPFILAGIEMSKVAN